MKSIYRIFLMALFVALLTADALADGLTVTEVCFENIKPDWPSWIEMKNTTSDGIDLENYKILSNGKIDKINEKTNLLPGEYLVICFYKDGKVSADFEKILPDGLKHLNIFNSDLFIEKITAIRQSDVDYFKDVVKEGKIKDIKDIFDKDGTAELNNVNDCLVFMAHSLSENQPELYEMYKKFAESFITENHLPPSIEPIFISTYYNRTLYSGNIKILSPSDEEITSMRWGGEGDTKTNLKVCRNSFLVKIKPRYLGYERKQIHQSFSLFMPVFYEYHSSPGAEQSIRPFKDLKLEVSDDHPQKVDNHDLRLTFEYVASYLPFPWGYEFEISSDKDFKNVLFKKGEKPVDRNPTLTHFYFSFTTADYENMILWNPELYYRARRILPDGYKTEWAGGECGELLRKRYNSKKISQMVEVMRGLWDDREALEKKQKELQEKLDKLNAQIINEKDQKKVGELKTKAEELQKKIEEISTKHTEVDEKYWKLKKEYRTKVGIKIP